MPDVENYPAPPCFEHFLANLPVAPHRRIRKRAKAMCQDVTVAQAGAYFEPARWRVVEMRHNRKARLLCDLECDVEGRYPRGAAGVAPHAHFDARDQITVGADDVNTLARIEEPQIGAFANCHCRTDGEDARKGDVEVWNDAQRRRLDDMPPEPVESTGAGAAGVDERRRPAAARYLRRIDTKRGPAPVDMRV